MQPELGWSRTLALKGEAESQAQVERAQWSLRLHSLTGSCSLQHLQGFDDFRALPVCTVLSAFRGLSLLLGAF